MTPAAPLLLFDFDGVIADSLACFESCLAEAARAEGVPDLSRREAFLRVFDENMSAGLRDLGLDEIRLARVLAGLAERLERRFAEVALFPGIADVLNELCRRATVLVITSNFSEVVRRSLERNGVLGVHDVIGGERERSKVRKIRAAMAEHPHAPAWYVGDTRGDMIEGREAGARTVAVTWGWHDRERLLSTKPDRVADRSEDLLALLER
jgi:phosphoglycolate phosphatase